MLHDLGAGNGTVLIDMANNEGRNLKRFCDIQKPGGAFLYLTYCAGGGGNVSTTHRLDRVDDNKVRLH